MANPREMTREQLAIFTVTVATAIANGKATKLLAAQNTSISDALTDANAILAATLSNLSSLQAQIDEAFELADEAAEEVQKLHGELKLTMRGADSPAADFEAVGYDAPDTTRTPVEPNMPTDLVLINFRPGIIAGKFDGNNDGKNVTYVAEAKIGDTAPWVVVVITTQQKFRYENVIDGQYYEFRVRAQAARGRVSDWSDSKVIYGT